MSFYLDEGDWIPVPKDWNRSIVQGKTNNTAEDQGLHLYETVQQKLFILGQKNLPEVNTILNRYGKEQLIKPRIGQGAFKVLITDAYKRRCAITGEKTLPVLESAHIKPYSLEGPHEVKNGLLLRKDFHTLFDRGYITVNKEYQVEVSPRIKVDFGNGNEYYAHHGQRLIILPERMDQIPDTHYLEWHNENIYLG